MGGGSGFGFNPNDLKQLEEKAKKELSGGKRNVFISFSHKDIADINLLRGQSKNENSDLQFSDHSVKEPFNSENADYIKREITKKIKQASVTVIYLSSNTSKSRWVKWEVEKSLAMGKGVVAVYQGDSKPKIPEFISSKIKVVPWKHKELSNAIENASQNR